MSELTERIRERLGQVDTALGVSEYDGEVQLTTVAEWLRELLELAEKEGWRRVEDEEPPKDIPFLMDCAECGIKTAWWDRYQWVHDGNPEEESTILELDDIDWWMPIPKLPEGDDG